jgi:small-conductance mechanosensitive channel
MVHCSKNNFPNFVKNSKFMKNFITILLIIAVCLMIFNVTQMDYKNPLEGKSKVALIGVVASACAALILLIFKMSKKIQEKF